MDARVIGGSGRVGGANMHSRAYALMSDGLRIDEAWVSIL
jgi:hypothetical protein